MQFCCVVPTAMGNPGSRDAETGTWKLVSGMKIYETSRISIHVSDPRTSWKIKINELLASALWELSVCPELVLVRLCYTLIGVLSQSPPSTDTRTEWWRERLRFHGSPRNWTEVQEIGKKIHNFLSWQKKTQEFFRWSHWIGGLIFWDSREECPQGEVRKVQRTRRTCDPSNKQGELLFCWWWFRLEHFCQRNTPPWSRIDWWSD